MKRKLVRIHATFRTMVHHKDCHMARRGKAMPWKWADGVPVAELLAAVEHFGYRQCQRCKPLDLVRREVAR